MPFIGTLPLRNLNFFDKDGHKFHQVSTILRGAAKLICERTHCWCRSRLHMFQKLAPQSVCFTAFWTTLRVIRRLWGSGTLTGHRDTSGPPSHTTNGGTDGRRRNICLYFALATKGSFHSPTTQLRLARSHAQTKRNDFPVGVTPLSLPEPPIILPPALNDAQRRGFDTHRLRQIRRFSTTDFPTSPITDVEIQERTQRVSQLA